jgi:hypothetical protein
MNTFINVSILFSIMRNVIVWVFFVFVLFSVVVSCVQQMYGVSVKINNADWESSQFSNALLNSDSILLINAHSRVLPPIAIAVFSFSGAGEYLLDSTSAVMLYGIDGAMQYYSPLGGVGFFEVQEYEAPVGNKPGIMQGVFGAKLQNSFGDTLIFSAGRFDLGVSPF